MPFKHLPSVSCFFSWEWADIQVHAPAVHALCSRLGCGPDTSGEFVMAKRNVLDQKARTNWVEDCGGNLEGTAEVRDPHAITSFTPGWQGCRKARLP